MAEEPFAFETLSKAESTERSSPKLSVLQPSFWGDLRAYLENVETAYWKAHAESATARKTVLLSDELRNASRKGEALWEARQKKITLQALRSARQDAETRPEHLTKEEASLFERLVALYREFRSPAVGGKAARATPAPSPSLAAKLTAAIVAPNAEPNARPSAAAASTEGDDITTVRALVDIPPFVGLDAKTYRLKKGEVATIPKKMAEILRKSGKVVSVS